VDRIINDSRTEASPTTSQIEIVYFLNGKGVDVEQDSETHANVVSLPHREDDLAEAERLAGLLAKKSHLVWQPERF
jgi:hypothetical protein